MTDALFRPFDLKKWFVLGFSAWLAELGARGGSGANSSFGNFGNGFGVDDLDRDAGELWQEIVGNGLLFTLGAFGCAVVLILALAVLWVTPIPSACSGQALAFPRCGKGRDFALFPTS